MRVGYVCAGVTKMYDMFHPDKSQNEKGKNEMGGTKESKSLTDGGASNEQKIRICCAYSSSIRSISLNAAGAPGLRTLSDYPHKWRVRGCYADFTTAAISSGFTKCGTIPLMKSW